MASKRQINKALKRRRHKINLDSLAPGIAAGITQGASADEALSQFPVLVAVIRRMPLALRTLENIRGGAAAGGVDECRQFQFTTAPLARRHLWYIHATLTTEG